MIRNAETIDDEQVAYVPSTDAIRQACKAIRETWSPGEERKRRLWSIAGPVMVPVVEVIPTTEAAE